MTQALEIYQDIRIAMHGATLPDAAIAVIEQAIADAVAEEREACAKIAHNNGYGGNKCCDITSMRIRDKIRARSNGGEK